jgi:hypothetical protein
MGMAPIARGGTSWLLAPIVAKTATSGNKYHEGVTLFPFVSLSRWVQHEYRQFGPVRLSLGSQPPKSPESSLPGPDQLCQPLLLTLNGAVSHPQSRRRRFLLRCVPAREPALGAFTVDRAGWAIGAAAELRVFRVAAEPSRPPAWRLARRFEPGRRNVRLSSGPARALRS